MLLNLNPDLKLNLKPKFELNKKLKTYIKNEKKPHMKTKLKSADKNQYQFYILFTFIAIPIAIRQLKKSPDIFYCFKEIKILIFIV